MSKNEQKKALCYDNIKNPISRYLLLFQSNIVTTHLLLSAMIIMKLSGRAMCIITPDCRNYQTPLAGN